MKITHCIFLSLAMSMIACQSDDSNFDELLAQAKEDPMEIEFSKAPLMDYLDEVPSENDESYNDYVESFAPKAEVNIEFSDNDAICNSSSSRISIAQQGAHVSVNIGTTAVRFILSGKSNNGSLRIEGENRFAIELNGVELTNCAGPAINNQCKKTLYMEIADGTTNVLSAQGMSTDAPDAKGCVFSEGQIAFSGRGELSVKSGFRNGIASDDYVFVRPGCRLYIECNSGNGIKANDGVNIKGGTIDILVNYDGGKGINSEAGVKINGGLTTIINNGTTRFDKVEVSAEFKEGIDTVSCAGVKCDADFVIENGQLHIKCTGDDAKGIKTNLSYNQTGGNVCVVTLGKKVYGSPKGIKSDGNIDIANGYLYSYSKHSSAIDAEGLINAYQYRKNKGYLVEVTGQMYY